MNFNISADKPLEKYRQSDISIVLFTLLLWGMGIFTLFICTDAYALRTQNDSLHFVKRQLISSGLGFAAFIFFATVSMDTIKKLLPVMVFSSMLLAIVTIIPGIGMEINGARRWIRLGFFTFQSSEMIKFVIVLYLANYFEKQSSIPESLDKTVFPAVLISFLMVAVIFAQSDLSTSVFVAALAVVLFIVSGSKIFWLVPAGTIMLPLGALFVILEPYRLERILGFLDQDKYLQTLNYQTFAARKAISAGGLWGQGMGSGLSKINSVPEIQSDYIFTGWVESMGFFGVLAYFVILALFAWRGISCSVKSNSRFASVAAFGFVFSIVSQSILNIAVVGGVVPTTGVPLPFFSSGGSSILFTLASCGFLLNASRTTDIKKEDYEVGEVIYE
ncbi:MAG: cell division protein FtsW [Treponema sp.]|nr:cell division protein FtsW [Candidatus Treponema equifaecale]